MDPRTARAKIGESEDRDHRDRRRRCVPRGLPRARLDALQHRLPPRESSLTQERIGRLVLAVEQLRAWQLLGRYPPSRLDEVAALRLPSRLPDAAAPNRLNEGVECLVLVARHLDLEIGIDGPGLANADLDWLEKDDGSDGRWELEEVVDEWGNPIVYLTPEDATDSPHGVMVTMKDGSLAAVRWKEDGSRRYQLISAGPDGRFHTPDDVVSW